MDNPTENFIPTIFLSAKRTVSLTRGKKRDYSGGMITPEIITREITLNDDCMLEIVANLGWADFININQTPRD